MTRVRIAGDDAEYCDCGALPGCWCGACDACCLGHGDDEPYDPGPQLDYQQANDEAIRVYRRGRGLEIVTDPLGRVA